MFYFNMSEKLNVARIKKFGNTFEISINPDAAIKYKRGEISDLREVLLADNIFSDAKKGMTVSDDELNKAFQTTDVSKIAHIILTEGEIQATAEHRSAEREQKRKQLIHMISSQAINPKTKLPHPPTRIEAALEEAKVHLEDHKSIEEQFDDIIRKLRPIIPISIEMAELTFTIPATYSGKAYNIVNSNSKILRDNWNSDGSWTVTAEMPAGMKLDFIEKLNSLTHGEVVVKE